MKNDILKRSARHASRVALVAWGVAALVALFVIVRDFLAQKPGWSFFPMSFVFTGLALTILGSVAFVGLWIAFAVFLYLKKLLRP